MTKYYEITDGNLHVGWASEDYMFTKMDERVLKGEANFNFHIGVAVDVAPVVRCKDCKYKQGSACEYSAVWVRPNGFCQWGERKENRK